ncbi:hypothetical protein [Priestia filamentosa]|uniref:Uncharacterized protein n=1 Tax=Priestia filamentosa TaxID=1402861 RepID=A0A0H4KFM0_9BACI|nr:hypothetical protein [Priestia filamentosa]AKO92922.1 hypothetical protein BEH_13000 [Priestia filamentosa]MDT3763052.1 hypothetical protein [Priestia filamentosa]OXS69569.1 hypothetical protein B1B01_11435 [Priestia filamentosa]RJS63781.1 hypothetical protein CJ485_03180 [Priestia filamentosa]WCM14076.1 hypothetical protein PGN40_11975 [Priestia filamentosa]
MDYIVKILVVILILLIQEYLSTRKNPYLGGILPIVYIGVISLFFNRLMDNNDNSSTWVILIVALCGLLSTWISGRERFKKKRQKELDRIELQNL